MNPELKLLLRLVDEGYERQAWQGPNLRGSIRGLTEDEASWRPTSRRHNIREIVVHLAYWKYAVRRRLTGERRGSFPLKGSNWFRRPDSTEGVTWKDEVALLEDQHRQLRATIAGLPVSRLHQKSARSRFENATLVYGSANHDVYHSGQIQLLKRLFRKL